MRLKFNSNFECNFVIYVFGIFQRLFDTDTCNYIVVYSIYKYKNAHKIYFICG